MLKKISVIFLSATAFFSLASISRVFADEKLKLCLGEGEGGAKFESICKLSTGKVSELIQNGVTILFIVAVIAALFFLIFGGIKWITSGGDKTQLETARNTIIASIIGLILVFSSFFMLNIALNFFGLPNIGSLKIPQLGDSGGGTFVNGAFCANDSQCISGNCKQEVGAKKCRP